MHSPSTPSHSLLSLGALENGRAAEALYASTDEMRKRSSSVLEGLSDAIESAEDPVYIEELFLLSESITGLLEHLPKTRLSESKANSEGMTSNQSAVKPNGGLMLVIPGNEDVHKFGTITLAVEDEEDNDDEEETMLNTPETPRLDKGKGRAEPEPVVHEPVLSPNYLIGDEEDEDGTQRQGLITDEPDEATIGPSPTDL